MYFTTSTPPSWAFGFWISEFDCFLFWFLYFTLTFSCFDNHRTIYSDKLASWRLANRIKTPPLLCWSWVYFAVGDCSLLYRCFLSVTKLVASKTRKFSLEENVPLSFRWHILPHVFMLLIVPVFSDNVNGYPSRFQQASWWLWRSQVKLLGICAFQTTAIGENHVSI